MKPDFFDEIELDAVADNTEDVRDSYYDIAFVFVFNRNDYEENYRQKLESIIPNTFLLFNYEITATIFHNEYAYITINLYWLGERVQKAKHISSLIISDKIPFCTLYILNNQSVLFKLSKCESNKFDDEIHTIVSKNMKVDYYGTKRIFGPDAVFGRNERLRLVNLNSTIDLTDSTYHFINNILKRADRNFCLTINDDIESDFESDIRKLYRALAFFLSQTIVFLVDERKIENDYEHKYKDFDYEHKYKDFRLVDYGYTKDNVLGLYFNDSKEINGVEKLVIEICPKRIEKVAENIFAKLGNTEIELSTIINLVYTIIIMHEFAHAMLDETNYAVLGEENEPLFEKHVRKTYGYSDVFRFVMEESLANTIMLNLLSDKNKLDGKHKELHESLFEITKKFVESQPRAYRFGLKQFEAKVVPCKWRTMKDRIDNTKAEEWLRKYIFNNEPYNAEAFNDLFDTKSNLIQ